MPSKLINTGIAKNLIELNVSDSVQNQSLFAEGLLWCYGFHHEQARKHFSALLIQEPKNPMALWGLAYAHSPFYNRPWSWFTPTVKKQTARLCYDKIEQAKQLCNEQEESLTTLLVTALSLLYPCPESAEDEQFIEYQKAYANRMFDIAQSYISHPDVITLTVEALLNCTPWALWDINKRCIAQDSKVESALALLAPFMGEKTSQHPGILHMHIHALEMSPEPHKAASSAKSLRKQFLKPTQQSIGLPPHLPHMATHIDVLLGHYRSAIETNRIAATRDHLISSEPGEFYQISRLHNHHMMLYAAMMAGRRADAMEAQEGLGQLALTLYDSATDPWLRISVEGFYAHRLHAQVRFGDWQAILDNSNIASEHKQLHKQPYSSALQCYAIGIALANLNESSLAELELGRLREFSTRVPPDYIINNNAASEILNLAIIMLEGEHEYHKGNTQLGIGLLERAVAAYDRLAYCEPWPWMHPPRHALGALLLEQNRTDAAQVVYETDLGLNSTLPACMRHPANIWSLNGLLECYQRNANTEQADALKPLVAAANDYADIAIYSSCYCRKHKPN